MYAELSERKHDKQIDQNNPESTMQVKSSKPIKKYAEPLSPQGKWTI